ncbi:carbohydrate sulfotransferase 15-like isoform X2 [Pomacea canaliculata]|nr:carbohydrate sulfotransferase 15-like isoform X2 [Pomacea canaliculata]
MKTRASSIMGSSRKVVRWPRRMRVVISAILILGACVVVTLALNSMSRTTLRVRLHSSQERFLREAIQDIQLLPRKLSANSTLYDDDYFDDESDTEGDNTRCNQGKKGDKSGKSKHNLAIKSFDEEDKEAGDDDYIFSLPEEEVRNAVKQRRDKWSRQMSLKRVKRLVSDDMQSDKHLDLTHQVLPTHLENYRNPCFYERERNISECRKGPFTELSSHAGEDNTTKLNTQHRLSCLPYFFVAGFPRSGAGDVMKRLTRHPDVTVPHQTSSEWLNRYRYGEVSTDILWDNQVWPVLPGNEGQLQPRLTNADYLYHLNPKVKVVIVLRDPVHRLYVDYWSQLTSYPFEASSSEFHQIVERCLEVLKTCLKREPVRSCVYDGAEETTDSILRIRTGMYYIMVQDWLRVFPRNQIHVINHETFQSNVEGELAKLFDFLALRQPDDDQLSEMLSIYDIEDDEMEDAVLDDPMEMATRELLRNFYSPWNKLLATVVEDESLLFD